MRLNIIFTFIFVIIVLSSLAAAEQSENYHEIEKIVFDAAREINPEINGDGVWYVGDDQHLGIVYFSEYSALEPRMQNMDYWNMEERMDIVEEPEWQVTSSITYNAPTPYGNRIVVTVDGYYLPLSDIQPIAENVFTRLVEMSVESGTIGEEYSDTSNVQEEEITEDETVEYTDTSIEDTEIDSFQDVMPEDIPPINDDIAEYEEAEFSDYEDNDLTEYDDEITDIDELFLIYDMLEEEGLIEYEGEMNVDDIEKQDIEDIQNIQMNYILPEEFVESMEQQAKIIDMIREESSEDIDKLDEIDTGGEQEVESNRDIIKDVFGDDFDFEAGSSVGLGGGPDYDGKEKVAEKLTDTIYLDALDKTRKESMEKLKTGHEAASFFSDDYGESKISKTFEKIDKLNSVKEEVDKYYGAYKDTKKLSEMKGASGTTAKALYAVTKGGQEIADKIPIAGELVKTGLEVAEKVVMVMPELDDAIKNSGARQGVITNGPTGTSTPNAFLSSYGKVTQTDDGPSYSLPYTDENGEKHEISPDQWVKVTTKTGTYYIPTDEWENPIGDIALKDAGSSWKPWKWDNCQVVKRSNPTITYNNGEEYDL